MPFNRVLTESDGPFTQQDGRQLYPWDVTRAVEVLANTWSKPATEVATILQENLRALGTLAAKRN